ncbi:MAG: hypothetical protein B7Y99_05195 [Caulobacterales bacterium 32-69-10]|nr:MAG: hypothetical protein B7Y99_05195 [Caulobacterales bacterium 32-69-10]
MKRFLALTLAALLLSGCATVGRVDAGADIHAVLVSIRDGDRATFEAHVDREALKTQLRARVISEVASGSPNGVASIPGLGAFAAGPLVDLAVDAFLRPEVFRAVAELRGYSVDRPIPGAFAIAQAVRPLGDGTACVFTKKDGPCVLVFRNDAGTWRLIGFEGDLSMLRPRR